MSLPRRRLVRPVTPPAARPSPERRVQKLRSHLEKQWAALTRWQSKLRRSSTTVEKLSKSIARIERQLTQLEG